MIDTDEVRKEIAIKYGFVIDKDDPVFASGMIFDAVLEQSVSALNKQQEANLKTMLTALQKSHEETKRLAMKVVNEGTEFTCDQLQTAIKATMDEGREDLRKDLRLAWAKVEASRKAAVTWAAVSGFFCALAAVLAAVLPLEGI